MKPSDFIEGLEKFFNDIVGTLIPGLFFVVSVLYIYPRLIDDSNIIKIPPVSSFEWFLIIILGYILGHFIIIFGNRFVINFFDFIFDKLRNINALKWLISKNCYSSKELYKLIAGNVDYLNLKTSFENRTGKTSQAKNDKNYIHILRSYAMTIASEDKHTVLRFMFISLFNLGIATVMILLVLIQIFNFIFFKFGIIDYNLNYNIWYSIIMLFLSIFFIEGRYEFYNRSIRVPFAMALARLNIKNESSQEKFENISYGTERSLVSSKYSVYLAGGFRSGWQDKIINKYPDIHFFDPRSHELDSKEQYTLWDLEAIRKCDYVFAYLENKNPGGFALACELGYAKALNKKIIFVDEKSNTDEKIARYLSMLHAVADVRVEKFEEGLIFLDKYLKM